jgi:hypothetical protein
MVQNRDHLLSNIVPLGDVKVGYHVFGSGKLDHRTRSGGDNHVIFFAILAPASLVDLWEC